MALTTQLYVSSRPHLCSPILSKYSRISRHQAHAFSRKDVAEKFNYIGTVRTFSKQGTKRRQWVLQASNENEVVSNEEKPVAAAVSTGAKNQENSSGPPVLTIIAGLLVGVGFLWAAGSVLLWFISLFFR